MYNVKAILKLGNQQSVGLYTWYIYAIEKKLYTTNCRDKNVMNSMAFG